MGEYKTPGVYIKEKNAFGNSVVEAETAIPAFIGITEKAVNGTESLLGKSWKITSMTEFTTYFGGAPLQEFTLSIVDKTETPTNDKKKKDNENEDGGNDGDKKEDNADKKEDNVDKDVIYQIERKVIGDDKKEATKLLQVKKPKNFYTLFYQMMMFFANGGSTCYVVSIGSYGDKIDEKDETTKNLKVVDALSALEKESEVTMVVVPEAVNSSEQCKNIQTSMLSHCNKMMNRFAIFDVQPKSKENETIDQQIETFQEGIGSNFLSYGAAYYPWLKTSVLTDNDITENVLKWAITSNDSFKGFIEDEKLLTYANGLLKQVQTGKKEEKDLSDEEKVQVAKDLHGALLTNWNIYRNIVKVVKDCLNCLPPSAAMAGVYTMVDNNRGVWKAPANVSVNYVDGLTEIINDGMQQNLNVPMNGKAINVIRSFPGEGIKVWGARTLDGNSQDWRYVNVRRTMLFLEESVKNAARAYVFEPNDANTWINMKCMIENFLRSVWKRGGLAGATPEDAFEVHVGLGDTMTGDDILEGILRITVLVAISRPAEFIEITFQQQMQKS